MVACSGSDNHKPGVKPVIHHYITGIAATGAYAPEGSEVQLRAAPYYHQISEDAEGNPIYNTELEPAEILTATVVGSEGNYTIDVGALSEPYLVRVKVNDVWWYSYADGLSDTANVNPYTDILVKQWYLFKVVQGVIGSNVLLDGQLLDGTNIDTFYDGIYTKQLDGSDLPDWMYGKPIVLPFQEDIKQIRVEQSFLVADIYGVVLEDVLTQNWVVGQPYDALLDDVNFDSEFLRKVAGEFYYNTDAIIKARVYYQDGKLKTEMWTRHGEKGIRVLSANTSPYKYEYPTVAPDENGIRHFVTEEVIDKTLITGIMFHIDPYNANAWIAVGDHRYDGLYYPKFQWYEK